jgi:hypothetical protein
METTKGSALSMGGVTILIVVLMIFFAVLPAYRSITDQLKNNEVKTKYLEELKVKKSILDKLASSYQDNISIIDYFYLYNNPVKNTETFAANIDIIAKWHESILSNISITGGTDYQSQEESPFTGYASLEPQLLQMEFLVKMENIPSLINSLEEFPLTIYINSMNIKQKQNIAIDTEKDILSGNDRVILTIMGELYFWKAETL